MTRIVVDLETAPDPLREIPMPDDWLTPPGNYTKPETIADWRAKREAAWPVERDRLASLDWRLGRIVALGWKETGMEPEAYCSDSEGLLLSKLWTLVGYGTKVQLVGFGIASFDLPWLLHRSAALRILPPRRFRVSRYDLHSDVLDWSDVLANYDPSKRSGWTLSRYAAVYGLPPTVGEGSSVPGWWAAGQRDQIVDHLRGDLVTTAALDAMFWPVYGG